MKVEIVKRGMSLVLVGDGTVKFLPLWQNVFFCFCFVFLKIANPFRE